MRNIFLLPVHFYRKFISPLLPPSCRFYPSCSVYAIEAVERFGIIKGSVLALWRILRCNPLCKGGFDYVPEEFPSVRDFFRHK
ncbi:MAG: membrane protein insertion efficiency factor YidD [Oscillospiraceae bacterium]